METHIETRKNLYIDRVFLVDIGCGNARNLEIGLDDLSKQWSKIRQRLAVGYNWIVGRRTSWMQSCYKLWEEKEDPLSCKRCFERLPYSASWNNECGSALDRLKDWWRKIKRTGITDLKWQHNTVMERGESSNTFELQKEWGCQGGTDLVMKVTKKIWPELVNLFKKSRIQVQNLRQRSFPDSIPPKM